MHKSYIFRTHLVAVFLSDSVAATWERFKKKTFTHLRIHLGFQGINCGQKQSQTDPTVDTNGHTGTTRQAQIDFDTTVALCTKIDASR